MKKEKKIRSKSKKSYDPQSLQTADVARSHQRGKRNAIRIRDSAKTRVDDLAIDVELPPAQLHLGHGTPGNSRWAVVLLMPPQLQRSALAKKQQQKQQQQQRQQK